ERLGAAHRTLALLPGFPLAHWLAATVYVARQVLGDAERELAAGLAPESGQSMGGSRFSAVALHWLLGLIYLARGDDSRALEEFERELAFEHAGQLYARECAANTWYAIGALRLRQGRAEDARAGFARALERVSTHPMARVGLGTASEAGLRLPSIDAAVSQAAQLTMAGSHAEAARIAAGALTAAPPGNAGWILPIEPLLHVTAHPAIWAGALAQLRNRAA